ncbi:hypothetical protein QM797_24100 [Rhodococcus sp. IEGM 1381]|uniref:hypothetical protein n=1 Tax=Rhodococcus sp. IEGM 1381 TaxID=3047085 RepID=UPI0024B6D278|nr:hypothetical protein [Rhodococcus sp. IEGM 1381]MDI9897816.1 hypothetical protein [Rhodococcus sp. IEGM 1381]
MSAKADLANTLARTAERTSTRSSARILSPFRVALPAVVFAASVLLGWFVAGYRLGTVDPDFVIRVVCGTLLAVPAFRAVQALVVPVPPGAFRIRHLAGITADSTSVFLGFVSARCRQDFGPASAGAVGVTIGVSVGLATVRGVGSAIPLISGAAVVAVLGGACAVIDAGASKSTAERLMMRSTRTLVVIAGVATSTAVTAQLISTGTALAVGCACAVAAAVCGERTVATALTSVQPSLDRRPSRKRFGGALSDAAAARTVPFRVLTISLVRSGELRRWFLTSALFAAFVLIWRASPFEIDLVTVAGILGALSMLGAAYSLRTDGIGNSWALAIPGGVRRDLVSRIMVAFVGASPCWVVLGVLRMFDGRLIDALVVPWVFLVCAMRAVGRAPQFADPNSRSNELVFQLVQVLLGSVSIALLDALSYAQSRGSTTALYLLVAMVVLIPVGYMAWVWKKWGEGGTEWMRIASSSPTGLLSER